MKKSTLILVVYLSIQWLCYLPVTSVAAPATNATLQDLISQVSPERLVAEVQAVSRFSRCVNDTGHDLAITYIKNRLQELGLTVEIQPFSGYVDGLRETRLQNIIVHKPGANPAQRHLITAHLDSSPTRLFPPTCNELAYGANDNGSGIVALIEIGRLLKNAQFKDDIDLVFFDGEEFGYLGSHYYVSQYLQNQNTQRPIASVINLDMIGYPRDGTTNQTLYAISVPGSSYELASEGSNLVKSYLPTLKYQVYTIGDLFPLARDPNQYSDQRSFWETQVGSAIFFNEDARDIISGDPRYHSPGDKLYQSDGSLRLDAPLMAEVTRAALLISGYNATPLSQRFFPTLVQPFEDNWSRADRPLLTGAATGRSWLWGLAPNHSVSEAYAETTGGNRQVVYFDKARMELTKETSGVVTNGLLVVEMTSGRQQMGDNSFIPREPSRVAVAGDPNDTPGLNDNAPTYASFTEIVARGKVAPDSGAVAATLDVKGRESYNYTLAQLARNVFYAPETGHNIPDVFFNWFQTQGRIYDSSADTYTDGGVFDWVSAIGLPISEAYWVRAKVGGIEQDVLVQLFERRTLTYTPGNPSGFNVEMGNVGLHYYKWRYR